MEYKVLMRGGPLDGLIEDVESLEDFLSFRRSKWYESQSHTRRGRVPFRPDLDEDDPEPGGLWTYRKSVTKVRHGKCVGIYRWVENINERE